MDNENYALKGYEQNEIISRTTPRQTIDGKTMYLATTKRCALDPEGRGGPYILVVVDNEEQLEFKLVKQDDGLALRKQFRESLPRGGELSVDEVIDRLELKYQSLS